MTQHRRVLIKLSGEGLAGERGFGIAPSVIGGVAEELRAVHELGVQIAPTVHAVKLDDTFIRIADADPSGSGAAAGLRVGDVLVAVQNADMVDRDLAYALQFIAQAPKVLNLRFVRLPTE